MSKNSSGKKEVGILVGVVLAGIAIFVVSQIIMNNAEDGGFSKNVPTLTYDELRTKIDSNEDFVLIYGAESCSFCQAYKPVVAEALKEDGYGDVKVYYIDIDALNDEDRAAVASYLSATSTPTSYIFSKGIMVESKDGKLDKKATLEFFDVYKTYTK